MTRVLPNSLFGRTLMVLLAGLAVSHLAAALLYSGHREQAVRAASGFVIAQRIANLSRLVADAPPDWGDRIVSSSSDTTFQVALTDRPEVMETSDNAIAEAVRDVLVQSISGAGQVLPLVATTPYRPIATDRHSVTAHRPAMHGFGAFGLFSNYGELKVAVPLSNGRWLSFVTSLPQDSPVLSRQLLVAMALMALITLFVSAWVVRSVTKPLANLARAAQRLEVDLAAPALSETGTIETRQAARSFNRMQIRLRELIENRTRMLAAISHDLRTPLTSLRLRAENNSDPDDREKMLATVAEMDAMIGATLRFARDDALAGPRRRTDLSALLASIVDDLADNGLAVEMEPSPPVVFTCQPDALKRALTNLLENGVKYGGRARARIVVLPDKIEVVVDDDGPGILDSELERVFQPFYRIESSRARETGGIGLGLAIARSIVEAHGGDLVLSNRKDGGLRARMVFSSGR